MFPEVSQRRGSSYPEPVQPSAYRHFITAHPESPEVSYAKIFPAAFRGTLASVSNPRLLPVRSPLYLRLYADSRRNRIGRRKYRLIARNGTRIPPNNGILRSLPIAMRGTCIYWSPHLLNSSRLSLMNHGCTRLSVDARRADVKARTFPRSSSIVIKRHDY